MARLESTANWFFVCLGIVMLGAGILVVPSNAFADAGGDCITSEGCTGLSGTALGSCVGTCCAGSSDSNCCKEACTIQTEGGPVVDSNCYSACLSSYNCHSDDADCKNFDTLAKCNPDLEVSNRCGIVRSCGCIWTFLDDGSSVCLCTFSKM
jgi:hypothetical protein